MRLLHVENCDLGEEHGPADLAVELTLLRRVHGLVLLETGERVVAAAAGVVGARVHRLARVVHLLVVLQVVLASK